VMHGLGLPITAMADPESRRGRTSHGAVPGRHGTLGLLSFAAPGRGSYEPPTHVKESFTAAIVVRSLWAAERSSWLVGVLVGWVAVRLVVCGPVVDSVVVAVDMRWFLCGRWALEGVGDAGFCREGMGQRSER
jgi:hypothetical protein